MNIYDFINSRDIREHWKKISYKPTALEAAWLVWQSHNHTLVQKHNAWQEIINTMPDCSIEKRPMHEEVRSLHTYLKNYMDFQEESLKRFHIIEPQVFYNGVAYYNRGESWDPSTHLSVEACINHYMTYYGACHNEHQYIGFTIDKFKIGEQEEYMKLSIDASFHVLDIKVRGKSDLFESLWFDFPIPFEKGDFVSRAANGYHWLYPFPQVSLVIHSLCKDNPSSVLKRDGTFADMIAYGNGCEGMIEMHPYMDLEYVDSTSDEFNNELLPISLFLKGKIDIMEMAEAYRLLANKKRIFHAELSNIIINKELVRILGIKE